jgi:AcrR family transcriptional regulator
MQQKKNVKKTAATQPVRRAKRSSQEIMERLLVAAREEFKRCGFVGATTAAIARNAEITEAQLFRYFSSKADLFREAVFEPLNQHFADFNARNPINVSSDVNVRDQARLYIEELQQSLGEQSKLLLSLVVAELFTSGSLQGVGEIESLRLYFDRGAEMMTNRVGRNAKVDPRLLVRVSFAAVLGCVLFKDWIFRDWQANDDRISAAIVDFVIDGISINHDPGLTAVAGPKNKKRKAS